MAIIAVSGVADQFCRGNNLGAVAGRIVDHYLADNRWRRISAAVSVTALDTVILVGGVCGNQPVAAVANCAQRFDSVDWRGVRFWPDAVCWYLHVDAVSGHLANLLVVPIWQREKSLGAAAQG